MKTPIKLSRLSSHQKLRLALFAWYGFMWSWVLLTDSLDLAGNKVVGMTIGLIVLGANIGIATFVMSRAILLFQRHTKRLSLFAKVSLAIPAFALADYLVAWLPALLWLGPQGQLDSILPLGSTSFLAIQTPLVYASRFVGFFGLAGMVWTVIIFASQQQKRKLALVPLGLLLILSVLGWGLYKQTNGPTTSVRIIRERLDQPLKTVQPTGEDLVIFPEYGLDTITNKNLSNRIKTTQDPAENTFFMGSTQVYKENRTGHENRILFGDTTNGITKQQDKYRLIPGGEDLPYIVRIGLRATGQKATLDYFSHAKSVIKSPEQLKPMEISRNTDKMIQLGAAVCSSIIAPQDFRDLTRSGATILSNSASLSTFSGSHLFEWQQMSLGRFMAVANSRYFMQSANGAPAYVYNNNGNVLAVQRDNGTQVVEVRNNFNKTLYTYVGEWLVWLGLTVVAVLLMQKLFKLKKTK